ncbi:hypothetical protein BC629DRAFT_1495554 [Irpex lacteus]|nr:hypothetical protein BC629DRAFT_1495554 [Irpex lacteus]
MDQYLPSPYYASSFHHESRFHETSDTCLTEALTPSTSYLSSTELMYPYDPSPSPTSSASLSPDQSSQSSVLPVDVTPLPKEYYPVWPYDPFGGYSTTEADHSLQSSLPFSDEVYYSDLFSNELGSSSNLGLNFASPLVVHSDYGMSPSTLPLTISPQLLHSPVSDYSEASTSVKTESPYMYSFGLNALAITDPEDDDDEYIGTSSMHTTSRRSTRRTRARAPQSPYAARSTTSPRTRQSSAEVHDAPNDDEPIRTRARRAEGKGVPNYNSVDSNGDFCCETCGHVCKPSRKVDFKRHVNTHYRHMVSGAVICCGVPVELRDEPQWTHIHEHAQVMTFYGRQMVGGCGRIFSRTDALKRHLELGTVPCVGDIRGDWHPSKQ